MYDKKNVGYLKPVNVYKYLDISKNCFYSTILKDPTFPKALKLTEHKKVWSKQEIDLWLQARQIVSDLQTKEGRC